MRTILMRFYVFSITGGNSQMSDSVSTATVPADEGKKLAGNGILWLFAIGQLGWSMLSGIISNWLVYYYQPGESLLSQGQQLFITQGAVFLGFTVIGLITAFCRLVGEYGSVKACAYDQIIILFHEFIPLLMIVQLLSFTVLAALLLLLTGSTALPSPRYFNTADWLCPVFSSGFSVFLQFHARLFEEYLHILFPAGSR